MRVALLFLLCLSSGVHGKEKFSFERELMGTRFQVVCYADDAELAAKGADAAFGVGEEVNQAASDYLAESEVVKLSSQPDGQPVQISPLLFGLLEHARRMAEATDGAYDPTLGAVTRLWRETRKSKRLPDAEVLEKARAATGWRDFLMNEDGRMIVLKRKGLVFDLGGIGKGYAADLMLEALATKGITQAMIVAGGDVRLGDAPPEREGWRVAVRTFDAERPDEILTLKNAAVSTSGDLYQSVEIEGVSYSHILDPATGLGLKRRIAATVVADTATASDALATAACVLGEGGKEKIEKIAGVRDVKMRVLQKGENE
jgi:FAD:protein FMN transferase